MTEQQRLAELRKRQQEAIGKIQQDDYVDPSNIQAETQIVGQKVLKPLEYQEGYVNKADESELYRQNYNRALQENANLTNQVGLNLDDAILRKNKAIESEQETLRKLNSLSQQGYVPDPRLESRIDKTGEELDQFKPQKVDYLAEGIANFLPIIGSALFGGEASRRNIPTALATSREIYGGIKKEEQDIYKQDLDRKEKRYLQLLKLKENGSTAFGEKQALELKKLEAELESKRAAVKITADDVKTAEERLSDFAKRGIDLRVKGVEGLSKSEQAAQQEKERLKRLQLEIQGRKDTKRIGAKSGGPASKVLALDEKKTVEALAGKNAAKISIKNQIESVLQSWDKLTDSEKVAAGRQLLKTLNSTEGADAIAAEEANRLGSKLEFAYGNLLNSNPTQFGRDLKGFYEQAKLTANSIGKSINENQKIIDKIYERPVRAEEQTLVKQDVLGPEKGKSNSSEIEKKLEEVRKKKAELQKKAGN